MNTPVLIIVYNRLQHLQQCIDSLANCDLADDTIVYISSDAAYTDAHSAQIKAIREYILSIRRFKQVVPIFHATNKGLVKAIHESVSVIFKAYDALIFMEDDNVVAPDFLTYMNAGLLFFKDHPRVITVSGFSQSIFFKADPLLRNQTYFTHRHCPWGYGIWKNKYLYDHHYSIEGVKNDLNDKNFVARLNLIGIDLLPSFKHLIQQGNMLKADYLFVYHMIKNDLVTVAPYSTKSFNTGNDGSGTRTKRNSRFVGFDKSSLFQKVDFVFNESIDQNLNNSFNERLNNTKTSRLKKRLDKLGLLKIGYAFHALKKKWK